MTGSVTSILSFQKAVTCDCGRGHNQSCPVRFRSFFSHPNLTFKHYLVIIWLLVHSLILQLSLPIPSILTSAIILYGITYRTALSQLCGYLLRTCLLIFFTKPLPLPVFSHHHNVLGLSIPPSLS